MSPWNPVRLLGNAFAERMKRERAQQVYSPDLPDLSSVTLPHPEQDSLAYHLDWGTFWGRYHSDSIYSSEVSDRITCRFALEFGEVEFFTPELWRDPEYRGHTSLTHNQLYGKEPKRPKYVPHPRQQKVYPIQSPPALAPPPAPPPFVRPRLWWQDPTSQQWWDSLAGLGLTSSTQQFLHSIGIYCVGQLILQTPETLFAQIGQAMLTEVMMALSVLHLGLWGTEVLGPADMEVEGQPVRLP